jgi:tetratricopeptide (TPR) repeat protein
MEEMKAAPSGNPRVPRLLSSAGRRLVGHWRRHREVWAMMTSDKWERTFALLLLFLFIVFSVLFFVFAVPRLSPAFSLRAPQDTGGLEGGRTEKDPAGNFSAGTRLYEEMNYSQALLFFQKAVEKDPDNVNYLIELAKTQYQLKNYEEAIRAYDRLLQLDGANEGAYRNRIGNIYWIRKDYARAEAMFRQAIGKDPKASVSYNNLALMLSEKGEKQQAVAVLEEGIASSDDGQSLRATLSIVEGKDNPAN